MIIGEERLFINELKILDLLKINLLEKRKQLEMVEYEMQGVRGLNPSSELGSSQSKDRGSLIISRFPIKDELEKEISVLEYRINYVENVLSNLDYDSRKLVIDIYVNGVSYEDAALMRDYSSRHLKRMVFRAIKRAISK